MPFKLKLKKSRQYNVVSKNLFVISVELLDNTVVECTLSSESTGQDCLSNVCQRLGLHQPEFFGLRFCSKHLKCQWVDLEKPLKKQLDKYANETYLNLGVMFYVSDVNQLQDEMTRYQYFLQLKTDIIDGRLQCNHDEAVQLASYSLQAEFGDHDLERHTTEYLKGFVLLPKSMTNNETRLEALTEEVVLAHRNLQGLSPAAAEIYYIMKAQQLDGYGQERFSAKDDSGNDLQVGVSLIGIIIRTVGSQATECFGWNDITNLTFHKRNFGVECEKISRTTQLQLEDADWAKYVWKVCVQQHQFYMRNKIDHVPSNIDSSVYKNRIVMPDLHTSLSQPNIRDVGKLSEHLSYSPDVHKSADDLTRLHHQAELGYDEQGNQYSPGVQLSTILHADSIYSINSSGQSNMVYSQNLNSASSLSIPSAQSGNMHLRVRLPSYRPAPDYETAVQCKYGTQSASLGSISASHTYSQEESMACSQQDIGQQQQQQQQPQQIKSYFHYKNFTDLANLDSSSYGLSYANADVDATNGIQPHRVTDRMSAMPNMMAPPMHTYSTPELTSQGLLYTNQMISNEVSPMLHHFPYKPPPPYPYNQRSSASTPDLASQTLSGYHQSSSSPDLVSRHQIGAAARTSNEAPTSEEITSEMLCKNVNEMRAIRKYSAAGLGTGQQPVNSVVGSPSPMNGLQEMTSLYNAFSAVPQLGSPHETFGMSGNVFPGGRSRASSTQSAPEIISNSSSGVTGSIDVNNSSRFADQQNNNHHRSSTSSNHSVSPCSTPDGKPPIYEKRKGPACKDGRTVGPMMMAAMNGLTLSRPDLIMRQNDESRAPKDTRRQLLESRLAEGLVFIEFEQVLKKRPNADYSTAVLPENGTRNRFKDVLPYEDNRIRLAPTKENKTGYINASHVSVTVGQQQRFYIAAQGPLSNTVGNFWQMVWEQNAQLIVMLTEVQEQGRDKCFLYWPQEETKVEFGEYQILKKFSTNSTSYITSSLVLHHLPSKKQRSVWHIQYTDWPDHGCPEDPHGFLNFMEEIDSVRRHAAVEVPKGRSRNPPVIVHCSAGVGRSGVTILTDVMLYCLDHNESIDVPKMLAHLRQQRMLIVQTVAQYKFIYNVLIQYLKNSRLI